MVSHVSIKVIIRDFMGLRDVEVEISKTLLYGPNAAGKSRVIYALMNVINHYGLMDYFARETGDTVKEELKGDYDVVVGDTIISVRDWQFKVRSPRGEFGPGSYDTVAPYIVEAFGKIKVNRVAWVTTTGSIVDANIAGDYSPLKTGDIKVWLRNPEEVEALEGIWRLFTKARRFYSNKVKVGNEWIPPSLLSAGERKAVMLTYLARHKDLLVIETFEGGLHIDMALDLIDVFSDEARYVVLETHYGLIVGKALERGWNVYYFDEGKASKIGSLREAALLEREVRAYGAIPLP